MGLGSVLRRVWPGSSSQSRSRRAKRSRRDTPDSPAPPSPPPPQQQPDPRLQEKTVISSYKAHLERAAEAMRLRWKRFDAEPDNHSLLLDIRNARPKLYQALNAYYAALGSRDKSSVKDVTDLTKQTDDRLEKINQDVRAEVDRLRHAAFFISSRLSAATEPAQKIDVCADANDSLVELELYGDGWVSLMDQPTRQHLQIVKAVLRNIVDNAPPIPRHQSSPYTKPDTPPNSRPTSPTAGTKRRTRPRQSSRVDPSYMINRPGQAVSTSSRTTSSYSAAHGANGVSKPAPSSQQNPPPSRQSDLEGSSNGENDRPFQPVISRSRTLHDMAKSAMKTAQPDSRDIDDASVLSPNGAPGVTMEQPPVRVATNASFASTLYHTRYARIDSISDVGLVLRRSDVIGDGRCLFRSLVRGRIAAKGLPTPAERAERDEADFLRARAVAEMKKHRRLLARFSVIEGNFSQYTKRMSHPKTHGGEPELLMLAKLMHVPIVVYIRKNGKYRQIQVYGKQYRGDPLRILYSDGIHYDSLIALTR